MLEDSPGHSTTLLLDKNLILDPEIASEKVDSYNLAMALKPPTTWKGDDSHLIQVNYTMPLKKFKPKDLPF